MCSYSHDIVAHIIFCSFVVDTAYLVGFQHFLASLWALVEFHGYIFRICAYQASITIYCFILGAYYFSYLWWWCFVLFLPLQETVVTGRSKPKKITSPSCLHAVLNAVVARSNWIFWWEFFVYVDRNRDVLFMLIEMSMFLILESCGLQKVLF